MFKIKSRRRVRSSASSKSNNLSFEVLECRRLFSVTSWMSGTTLKIAGDAAADWISVVIVDDKVWFNGTGMGSSQYKLQSQVSGIDISGEGGNDTINVLQSTKFLKPIRIFGKDGNDTIKLDVSVDGSARYSVDGGNNSDTLNVPRWMPVGTSGFPSSVWSNVEIRNLSSLAQAQGSLRGNPDMNSIWRQIQSPITNSPTNRNAYNYLNVIEQFEVGYNSHLRFNWDSYGTKCNVFAGDVMRGMQVPLPTKIELGTGSGSETSGAVLLNQWLNGNKTWPSDFASGPSKGWVRIDANNQADLDRLLVHIKSGKPALASTATPNHIAVVRPDQTMSQITLATLGDILIAQAGAKNFNLGRISDVDGWRPSVTSVQFFINGGSNLDPTKTVYASDLHFAQESNGWGPVERDRSNGEQSGGDGRTITLNNVPYTRGLGVHSDSLVELNLNGRYSTFVSDIGIDDESGANGSVIFKVLGDGILLFQSPIMRGNDTTQTVNVSTIGIQRLRLQVLNADGSFSSDHADWAGARLLLPQSSGSSIYASDMYFASHQNGWGNAERDRSNGEQGSADGRQQTINGTTYSKGIGVHSFSRIDFNLQGRFSRFESFVGVDDEVGNNGNIEFVIQVDGVDQYSSGSMTGSMGSKLASVNLIGKLRLSLIVRRIGTSDSHGHGNWADAKLSLA